MSSVASEALIPIGIIFGICVVLLGAGFALGAKSERSSHGTAERLTTENAHCAREGGRLLRGQGREYVCVEPRGVKWVRVP